MKIYLYITLLLLLPMALSAQDRLVNNGANIKVLSNTYVKVKDAGVENKSDGVIANEGDIHLDMDWVQTGVATDYTGNGWMRFEGAAIQNISGVSLVNNLSVNNGNRLLVQNNDLSIGTQIALFLNGSVELGAQNLLIGSAAAITGYDDANYVITNGAGGMRQQVGASSIVFPVGNSSYNPAVMSNSGALDGFTIRVEDQKLTGGTTGPADTDLTVDRSWHIDEATPGGSNASVTLQWMTNQELSGFDRNVSGVVYHDGTTWVQPTAFGPASAAGANTWTQSRTGLSDFSPFSVESCAFPNLPVLTTSDDTICPGGSASATITIVGNLNGATDWVLYTGGCGNTQVATTSGSTFSVSPTVTTTYYVRGEGGCAASGACSTITIVVSDLEAPTITCPANITVSNDPGVCNAVVTVSAPSASDNCGIASVVNDYNNLPSASGTYPVGTTTVTFIATDNGNNSSTCSLTVSVNDTEAPVIACPANITANTIPGLCKAYVVIVPPTTSDNCGIAGVVNDYNNSPNATDDYVPGVTTVLFTVTDVGGNTASCNFTVTVNDTEPPAIACPTNITVSNDPGVCNAAVTVPAPTVGDNCGIASVANDYNNLPNASATYPVGTTTVTFTATDNSNNSSTCSFTVTVNDTEAPVITCPANITVSNDPGVCNAAVTVPAPSVSDNCGIASVVNDYNNLPNASATYPVGTTTVTFTATDNSNNSSTCSFTVSVNDTEAPVITCPANVVTNVNAAVCSASITVPAPSASDNCGVTSVLNNFNNTANASGTYPLGTTTVVFTAMDGAGNTGNCSFTVTVSTTLSANAGPDQVVIFNSGNGPVPDPCDDLLGSASGGGGAYSYLWTPSTALNNANIAQPEACPTVNTTYTLTVSDVYGCTATDDVFVQAVDLNGPFDCANNGCNKVFVCLNGNTIAVNINASCNSTNSLCWALNNGATLGSCSNKAPESIEGGLSMEAFPNPFEASTTLRFSLNEAANVSLKVYSMTGTEVAVLFDQQALAGRSYTADFAPEGISKGIYFAKLVTSNGEARTLKLVLIK